jgi:hypothetical protein
MQLLRSDGENSMAIRNRTELRNHLIPFLLTPTELDQVVNDAKFEDGKCRGMNFGPLKSKLAFIQFEKLMNELNVRILVGAKSGDQAQVHKYPTGRLDVPCIEKDDHFCNPG